MRSNKRVQADKVAATRTLCRRAPRYAPGTMP